jgi:hypothetical protein
MSGDEQPFNKAILLSGLRVVSASISFLEDDGLFYTSKKKCKTLVNELRRCIYEVIDSCYQPGEWA